MDGNIVIGTKVDTSGIDEGIKNIEKKDVTKDVKINFEEKKFEDIDVLNDVEVMAWLKLNGVDIDNQIQEITDELHNNLKLDLNTQSFDVKIAEAKAQIVMFSSLIENANKIGLPDEDVFQLAKALEEANNKLVRLNKLKIKASKNTFNDISKSLTNIVGKVGKWGLALFGIRGAYSLITHSMSILKQYDDQMASDLEYMSWVIANTLKPVIEWIIEAVYSILGAIGAIIKGITGTNIFANSSAKAFEKIKKNAKDASKSTKEIKKDLYGWDEATRIEESSGLAGMGKTKSPNKDLSKETDDMFKKAKKNAKEINALATVPFVYIYLKIKDAWDKSIDLFKDTYKDILKPYIITPIKNTINEIKELLKPITNFFDEYFVSPIKGMFSNLRQILTPIINGIIDDVNHLLEPLGLKIPRIENKIKISTKSSGKAIEGALIGTDKKAKETGNNIEENITDNIKDIIYRADELGSKEFNIDIKAPTLNPIEQTINKLKEGLKTLTGKTWKMNASLAISGATKGAVSGATQINTVNVKMAKGGILNRPGRGVPVGGALAGEKGREFYMPLQDEQMLGMVGEAIGRYVTINLTNIIKMNARQLAKEMKTVSAENDFATNS